MMLSNLENKIILIVEDVASNHVLIERSISKIGLKTIWANNGKEAISICKDFDNICLILMDIRLPILDGYEATKEIRKIYPTIPIIAQTAYLMPYEKVKATETGFTDLITKPYKSSELIEIVNRYL